ncbi:MAG TPA: MlaD family protein [Candidatus Dormibacteraeota bacterium]|jgi:phospholipid/cholesterol/gamma-HCH transport system substrate-binding protein|nr:MlaD family protein [Candidatus Dormibacteraeota bacterium]
MAPPHQRRASHTHFDDRIHLTLAGRTALIACFVATCFAGILATIHLIGAPLPLTSQYHVSAIFSDAQGVIPDSSVTIGGAVAGRVEEVSLTPQGAKVTMRLLDRWQSTVHRDATASIRIKSLLGEHFVNIDPGTPGQPLLASDSTLGRHGTMSVELTDVLNMLDQPTRASMGALLGSLGHATDGRGGDVNTAIRDLRTLVGDMQPLTGTVAHRSDDVRHLIASADAVTRDLAAQQGDLGGLVSNASAAFGSLDRDKGSLRTLIDSGDTLARQFSSVLDPRTRAGLRDTLQNAGPALGQTAALGSTLAPTVERLRPGLPSYVALLPELRSTWSAADGNGHYVRVLVLTGSDAMSQQQNGDRRPAPVVTPPGGQPAAPGFPPRPSGAPAGSPADLFLPDSPLWTLIFGGM